MTAIYKAMRTVEKVLALILDEPTSVPPSGPVPVPAQVGVQAPTLIA